MIIRRQQYLLHPSLSMASLSPAHNLAPEIDEALSSTAQILPIRHAFVKHFQVALPHVSDDLCNSIRTWFKRRRYEFKFTLPHEKHRTGMIMLDSALLNTQELVL